MGASSSRFAATYALQNRTPAQIVERRLDDRVRPVCTQLAYVRRLVFHLSKVLLTTNNDREFRGQHSASIRVVLDGR